MKNQFNVLNPQRQPGPLVAALGAKVEQFYALDHTVQLSAPADVHSAALQGTADIWAEALTPIAPNIKIDLLYNQPRGWLDQQPAMVTRALGKRTISYLGTLPDAASMDALLKRAALQAGLEDSDTLPSGIELCERQSPDEKRRVLIVINHSDAVAGTTLSGGYRDLLHQATVTSVHTGLSPHATLVELPAQDVAVLIPEGTP